MNQELAPLISIIIAVFNGSLTLQQCIDSVARQTYPNKELIVIDGGSKDGTVDLLNKNRNKFSYFISETDHGIYNAWNKGLAHAQGEWICFLGADDFLWDPTVLERMVVHLQVLPQDIRVAYGQVMLIGVDGEPSCSIGKSWEQARNSFGRYMSIPHVGTMHRRELFEQHGTFNESFQIAGDYELLLRELIICDAAHIPNIIVAGQRLGGISTDTKNNLQIILETLRAQRIHGLPVQWRTVLWGIAYECRQLVLHKVSDEQSANKLLTLRRRITNWFR